MRVGLRGVQAIAVERGVLRVSREGTGIKEKNQIKPIEFPSLGEWTGGQQEQQKFGQPLDTKKN